MCCHLQTKQEAGVLLCDTSGDIRAALLSAPKPQPNACENVNGKKSLPSFFFFSLCGSSRSLTVSVVCITQPVTSIFHTAVSVSGNFAALISYLGQREAIAESLSCLSGLFHNSQSSFSFSYSPG